MRIGNIELQKTTNHVVKKVTKPLEKPAVKQAAIGFSATAVSGIYLTLKAVQQKKEREEQLKDFGFNKDTVDKILNAKTEKGQPVFDNNGIKILKEVSELNDKTFYSNIIKNLDGIKYLEKNNQGYSMSAKTKDGNLTSKMIIDEDNKKYIETQIFSDNSKTLLQRNNDGRIIEEKTLKTVNNKTVLNETVKYHIAANYIERTLFDNHGHNERLDYNKIKFSSQGIINNIVKASSDYSDTKNVKTKVSSIDYKNNIKLDASKTGTKFDTYFDNYLYYDMESITRTVKNPVTGKFETIKLEKSTVPNVYNSYIIDENGNKRTESKAEKDLFGNISIEKNLESLDGTKTHYTYKSTKDENNIKMHYQVVSSDGKVLTTVDRTFNRVNSNLAYSSVNGHKYKIETSDKAYTITDELTGEVTEIKKDEKFFYDEESAKNSEIIDKLSGDMLLDMYKRGYKYHYSVNTGGQSDHYERRLYSSDDVYVFAHEQGHTKDIVGPVDIDYNSEIEQKSSTGIQHRLINNPVFRKPYEEERSAFIKAFSDIEKDYVKYYIDRIDHYMGYSGGACEMMANINAITSTAQPNQIDNVAYHYLQKYFPRTIAAAQALLNPNGNIYVKQ